MHRHAKAHFNACTREFTPYLPEDLHGEPRRKERKRQLRRWQLFRKHSAHANVHFAYSNFHVEKDGRLSKPAWMGKKASADTREFITQAISSPGSKIAKEMLSGITLIPYVASVSPYLSICITLWLSSFKVIGQPPFVMPLVECFSTAPHSPLSC